MNICLNRSLGLAKCFRRVAFQQVAFYNDNPKNFQKKKERRHHINRKRKTTVLRKMLTQYEPTEHDVMFEEAVRFSEAQFRAQILHLREEWGKMYTDLDMTSRVSRDLEYSRLEEERDAFIEQIEHKQAEKREKIIPDKHADKLRETLEEEYRRSTLASPEVEVESFLKQQEDDTFVTPQNFDHFIDQLLSENQSPHLDKILTKKHELRTFKRYDIEYVLDSLSSEQSS